MRHWVLRSVLNVFLALSGFLIAGVGSPSILAVVYATAVTFWWVYRLWVLLRLPADTRHAP